MYLRGCNRLFYRSKTSGDKTVEFDVLNPHLERTKKLLMYKFEDNLYYTDIWFKNIGSYYFRVFENGEEVHREILPVGSGSAFIVYPDSERLI